MLQYFGYVIVIAPIVLGSTDLKAYAQAVPDCGSKDSTDLIISIIKENSGSILASIKNMKNMGATERTYPEYSETMQKITDLRNAINNIPNDLPLVEALDSCGRDACRKLFGPRWSDSHAECWDTEDVCPKEKEALEALKGKRLALSNEIQDLSDNLDKHFQSDWETALATATYSLDAIRNEGKDQQTGAVSCAANFTLEVPNWGKVNIQDLGYKIEVTTDGRLYGTIYPPQN